MLSELQLGEFIYEQPAVGDVEYIFKHALTHDVAYNSVLNERRRMLHERIGAALESIHADSLEDHVAELAHHYARSGNPGKAVEYCLRAVQQCAARASFAEAVAQFETGLEQLQKLPDDDRRAELELDLRIAAAVSQWQLPRAPPRPKHEKSSARPTELRQRLTIDFEKTWFALGAAFLVQFVRPDMRKACEVAGELIALAEERGGTVTLRRRRPSWLSRGPPRATSTSRPKASSGGGRCWNPSHRAARANASTGDGRAAAAHSGKEPRHLGSKPLAPGLPGSCTGAIQRRRRHRARIRIKVCPGCHAPQRHNLF